MSEAQTTQQPVEWGEMTFTCPQHVEKGAMRFQDFQDGSGRTFFFDALSLSLQGERAPQNGIFVVSLEMPVSVRKEKLLRGFQTTVRGFAQASSGGSATVLAHVGGAVKCLEFAPDQDVNQQFTASLCSSHPTVPGEEDPEVRVIEPLALTLVISVQRRSLADSVQVQIDTVDVASVWAWQSPAAPAAPAQ
jgi:hypothetical protein